jgi:broad specificity phosphatase PhoE
MTVTAHGESPRPRLVIVRHGDTEWSRAWRHTGRTDVALTTEGRARAKALRPALSGRTFALVLTSPLQRARVTAELAGFPDAQPCDDLLEWDYGDDEGRTSEEIRDERPGWLIWTDGPKNGESIDEVAARTDRVIDRALQAGGDTLAFAHGHVLRILAARWIVAEPELGQRLLLATASPSTLGWEHDYRVVERWSCGAD